LITVRSTSKAAKLRGLCGHTGYTTTSEFWKLTATAIIARALTADIKKPSHCSGAYPFFSAVMVAHRISFTGDSGDLSHLIPHMAKDPKDADSKVADSQAGNR
jgi:hypothetical protein